MARHLLKIEWDLRAENQLLQSERLPTEIILQAFEAWYSANKFLTHSRDDYLAEFLEAWQTVKIPSDGALRRIGLYRKVLTLRGLLSNISKMRR